MDSDLVSIFCLTSAALITFLLSYEFEFKIKPRTFLIQQSIPNFVYYSCVGCGRRLEDLLTLEKCGHKLCKVCLEVKLRDSPVTWQDPTGNQSKISPCPICKEFFRVGGHKLF